MLARWAALALVLATPLALAPAALAQDVSRAQLTALAERAADGDEAAFAALAGVRSVDGVPFDAEAVFAGAEAEELRARSSELARASTAPTGSVDEQAARELAREILAGTEPPPATAGDEDEGAVPGLPGLPLPLVLALAALVLVAGAAGAWAAARRSLPVEPATGDRAFRGIERGGNARELEREAAEAERSGDHRRAVRLRFHAGLLRLGTLGAVRLRPSLTAKGAVRESGVAALAPLADSYERIVFGGRDAGADDSRAQREGWQRVLSEARR